MDPYANPLAQLRSVAVPATAPSPLLVGTTAGGPPDGPIAIPTLIQDLQTVGATIGRTYLSALNINPSLGVFDFTYRQGGPDLWVTSHVNAGMYLILQDVFSPNFFFQGSPTHSAQAYLDSPPYSATPGSDWDYWVTKRVTFLTRAAQQYRDARIKWELGNEMNVPGIYWHYNYSASTAPTPQAYADYFMRGCAAIKAVNPGQEVMIGGLLRVDSALSGLSGIAFMQQLKPYFDAAGFTPDSVSLHPYMLGASNSNPSWDRGANAIGVTSWQSTERFLNALDALGYHIPVHLTEIGFRGSQSNAQNSFNCNSEATKAIWNRYEHDNTYYMLTKEARGPGKAYVASLMYYRDQEYPSPTASSYSGAMTGDPPEGPHALTAWGQSLQDFTSRLRNRLPIPKLEGFTMTCPSSAVVGGPSSTVSVVGVGINAVPDAIVSSDPSVVTVGTLATGASSASLSFPGVGKATIKAYTYSATRTPITAVQTIDVQAQVPTASVITPGNGFQVATSNGGTIQFTVAVTDQIGNPIVSPVGTWSSSDATNFPVNATTGLGTAVGVVTGVVVTYTPTGYPGAAGTSTGNVTLNPVLQIATPATTLINVGALDIVVNGGAVTGCTLLISDATKATASGQTLVGKGTSGTFTVVARKAGYDDSSPVTFTCSGGGYLDDKDTYGFTNGQAVSTYTDLGSNTWANATGTKQPTANTNDLNGHTSLVFDGVDDYLRANAAVSQLNGSGVTYAALVYPTSASVSANEQMLDNRDATNFQGFVLGRNASTLAHFLFHYTTASSTMTQRFDGTAMAVNTWVRMIDRLDQGAQSRMLDGVLVGASSTDAIYRNPTTNPVRTTKGGNWSLAAGNNAAMHLALEILVNRAVTDAERLQIDRRLSLYVATAGTGGAPTSIIATPNPVSGATGDTVQLTVTDNLGADVTSRILATSSDPSVVYADYQPTLTGISPSSIAQGATGNIVLTGTNFTSAALGQGVSISGSGITINSTTFNSATQITVNVTVSGSATVSSRTVKVTDSGHGDSGTQSLSVTSSGGSFTHNAWAFQDAGGPLTSPPAYVIVVSDPDNSQNPFPYPQSASGLPDWGLTGFGTLDHVRTRDPSYGQTGGMVFQANDGTQAELRRAIANGTYDVNVALGDIGSSADPQYCYIYDDTTLLASVVGVTPGSSSQVINLLGSSVAITSWAAGTGKRSLTFTTGICRVKFGSPTAQTGKTSLVTVEFTQTA